MVRPAAFGWNPQTFGSNHFQPAAAPLDRGTADGALLEFDALAAGLARVGVEVHALQEPPGLECPDAVFPNNWITLHADGSAVLYPMLATNRRRERRRELVLELARRGGFRIRRWIDLTRHETQGRFLEGTGSVVFDHTARIAYACASPRTDPAVLGDLCGELGYDPHLFEATGTDGTAIYHTNVALAIGSGFAVVCAEAVGPDDRGPLLERLAAGGRQVEMIDRRQMESFAGNVLELRAANGARILAASARGLGSLTPDARARLAARVDEIIAAPVPTIESVGGGSVRCMLAEVFLPRDPDAALHRSRYQ